MRSCLAVLLGACGSATATGPADAPLPDATPAAPRADARPAPDARPLNASCVGVDAGTVPASITLAGRLRQGLTGNTAAANVTVTVLPGSAGGRALRAHTFRTHAGQITLTLIHP
jgi:hypothetical protein